MAKKAQPAVEAEVATKQVAVLTDSEKSESEDGAQAPAVTEPTEPVAEVAEPKKARRPRAAKAKPTEEMAPVFAPSTATTLAEVTEQVETITQPLQGAVMDFTGTSDDDPRATQRRGNARLILARLPGQLTKLKAEVEKAYGPESAEGKLVEQALAETHEVLGGLDLFDLDPIQRAMARAAQVLEKSTDPQERVTARQALRELREQLREAHNLTREYGFDTEVVEDLVETLEATLFTFGLTVEGNEEAKLAAADEAAQPVLVDCPYPTLEVEGLPADTRVIHLKPDQSIDVRFFMGSGVLRKDNPGAGAVYRLETLEGTADGQQFRLTATVDVNLLVVEPIRSLRHSDGQCQVLTSGVLAYLAGQADARLAVVEAEAVEPKALAILGRLLGGFDHCTQQVKDQKKVLTHAGEVAVVVKRDGKVTTVTCCRPGQLAKAKKDAAEMATESRDKQKPRQQPVAAAPAGIPLGQFMPPETAERLQAMANGHTAATAASATTQSAEPAQSNRPAPRPTQARPTAAPKTAAAAPKTEQPAQPVAQTATKPTLVNKTTESAPGIRLLAVPGEGRRLKTLQLDPGVKLLTDGFVSSLSEWAEVTGEVEGGLELTVNSPVVVTVGCHESGSWLRQGEVDVQQVLFACEPTETYLAPASRMELESSSVVMDHLERVGELVYETGVEDAFDLLRYARVERDQHLLVYRTTRDGRPVNRVAVVTPSIVADARQECGIR